MATTRCLLRGVTLLALALVGAERGKATAEATLTAAQARRHVGETRTVCGEVASARYAESARRQPTFLNLDRAFPNQIFTVVIWGADRPRFPRAPEQAYRGKPICATGRIGSYKGVPEIVVTEPRQIEVRTAE
jgi:micrococcal nuclease